MEIKNSGSVYSYVLKEMEWYGVSEEGRQSTIATCKGAAQDHGAKHAVILVVPDALMSISPIPRRHRVWAWSFEAQMPVMGFSQAVRYMMDMCDKHGLHHEVLADFMHQYEQAFNENEKLCRESKEQVTPNYTAMANAALWEWDIG